MESLEGVSKDVSNKICIYAYNGLTAIWNYGPVSHIHVTYFLHAHNGSYGDHGDISRSFASSFGFS